MDFYVYLNATREHNNIPRTSFSLPAGWLGFGKHKDTGDMPKVLCVSRFDVRPGAWSVVTLSWARSACSMLMPPPFESLTLDLNSPDVSFEQGLRTGQVQDSHNIRS